MNMSTLGWVSEALGEDLMPDEGGQPMGVVKVNGDLAAVLNLFRPAPGVPRHRHPVVPVEGLTGCR